MRRAIRPSPSAKAMRADRDSVRRKLKIARGQLDGILQMIDDDRYCVDISNQLLATQSLLKSANQQIMRAHRRLRARGFADRPYRPQARRGLPAPRAHGAVVTAQGRQLFLAVVLLLFDQILAVEFLSKAAVRCAHVRGWRYYRRGGMKNTIPTRPKSLPPSNAARSVHSGASPTLLPTTCG